MRTLHIPSSHASSRGKWGPQLPWITAVMFIVLPVLLAGACSPDPTPRPSADGSADAREEWTVTTDGDDILLRSAAGAVLDTLYDGNPIGEATVVALAVRPGSTRENMVVAFLAMAEGMYDLRYVILEGGGQPEWDYLPAPYQIATAAMPARGTVPAPVWSPDGRHLAWVEENESTGSFTLSTIGWSDGPGTGRTADDNADFALDPAGLGPGDVELRLEGWRWTAGSGVVRQGVLLFGARTDDGGERTLRLPIERQADGALALPTSRITPVDTM